MQAIDSRIMGLPWVQPGGTPAAVHSATGAPAVVGADLCQLFSDCLIEKAPVLQHSQQGRLACQQNRTS